MTRLAVAMVAAALVGCGVPSALRPAPLVLAEREVYLMGTRARLVASDVSADAGTRRLNQALEILEQAESELSTWREDSAISRLNRHPIGQPFQLPGATCRLFGALEAAVTATEGTFDPAIGRLTDAWDIHGDGRIPDDVRLVAARAISGWALLDHDAANCRLTRRAGATIDVGAFGKGQALDRVRAAVAGTWLIDLGGQVAVSGTPPGEQGWRVSIAHPRDRQQRWLDVVLPGGSLSTSGGSERDRVVDGTRVAHILDPRSGRPAPFEGSVSVWHEESLQADMLSTALYVMGPEAGITWATARGLAAVYAIPQADGTVRVAETAKFTRLRGR